MCIHLNGKPDEHSNDRKLDEESCRGAGWIGMNVSYGLEPHRMQKVATYERSEACLPARSAAPAQNMIDGDWAGAKED